MPDGSPVANGRLFLKLSKDAFAFGVNQVASSLISFTLDVNGNIPANTQIWANDELTPAGTTYAVSVTKGLGLVWGSDNISIAGISPININNLTP